MDCRKILAAAGSCVALLTILPVTTEATPSNSALDANGKTCYVELNSGHQFMSAGSTVSAPDRPCRSAGQSDARLDEPLGFARRARDLICVAVPVWSSDDRNCSVRAAEGIIVLDADAGYAFVKRIGLQNLSAPLTPEEVSAMMAILATKVVYVSNPRTSDRDRPGDRKGDVEQHL